MSPPRPEVLAFLQDIKQNPDDDTPRLILADWLEERGDPRGAFLRLELEAMRPDLPPSRRSELGKEIGTLLRRYEGDWFGPLRMPDFSCDVLRGLVRLRARGAALLERLESLAATEAWAWVSDLTLYDLDDATLLALGTSAHLGQLSSLSFHDTLARDAGLAAC
jgi:uncharacterized protein (TIGR02996 family)